MKTLPSALDLMPLAPLPTLELLSADKSPYRTLVEALEYGVLLYDPSVRVLVHNRSAEGVLHLSAAEIGGHDPVPDGWHLFYDDGTRVTLNNHPVTRAFETRRVQRDMTLRLEYGGHSVWLQVSVQPLLDAAGEPYAAVGSMIDITAQRRAHEQLGRQHTFRTRLGELIEASLQDGLGPTFYQRLMEGAVEAIPGAQAGSLLLRSEGDRYAFSAAVNFDQQVLERAYLEEHELYRDPTISGPQLIYGFDNSHIGDKQRVNLLYEAGDTGGIKVSLSIPIEVGGQTVAYFNLDNFDDADALGREATEMGQLFAHQVAALWRRFRLEAELQQEQQALKRLAFFDPLTGLPNRTLLADRLRQALLHSGRSSKPTALIFLDLDNFKQINDAYGHNAGDTLLRAVALRLGQCVRSGDTVARWGGDEFVVLLPQISAAEDAAQVARKILSTLAEPFRVLGHDVFSGASLGVSVYPDHANGADELIKHADTALYRVKGAGKQGFEFYSHEMNARLSNRLTLEADLRYALSEGSLTLSYQPRVNLLSGATECLDVQVHWPHPEHGHLGAAGLVPLIEETGLIGQLSALVLRLACQQLQA